MKTITVRSNDLWPGLNVPVYASASPPVCSKPSATTRQAAKLPVTPFKAGDAINVGPFSIEGVEVSHSIPEPMSLMIRTPLGNVVHTGDWKIDHEPSLGPLTDEARFRQLGDEGVLALMCDSTNALRDGVSPSEKECPRACARSSRTPRAGWRSPPSRRMSAASASIAEAAEAAGREVLLLGSSLKRVVDVARDIGLMEGVQALHRRGRIRLHAARQGRRRS